MKRGLFVIGLALLFILPSSGVEFGGNPKVHLEINRPVGDLTNGTAELTKARVYHCDGGFDTYFITQSINPITGYDFEIAPGDYCGIRLYWNNDILVNNSTYSLAITEPYTNIPLGTTINPVLLSDFEVTSGTFSGGAPRLYMSID